MNSITLLGNLTRDPELHFTPTGVPNTKACVAVSEKWKGKDGQKKERTCFVNLVFWGKTAETIQKYFTKGSPILVQGRLDIRTYEKDGQKHYFTEVVVDKFHFVNGRRNGNGGASQAQGATQQTYQGARVVNTPGAPSSLPVEDTGTVPAVPDSDIPW